MISFEVSRLRQPHPLLSSSAVGSPAFLNAVSAFNSQQPTSPVSLFTPYSHLNEENFNVSTEVDRSKMPLREENSQNLRAKNPATGELVELMKYADLNMPSNNMASGKSETKKSLNEIRQQQMGWDHNFTTENTSNLSTNTPEVAGDIMKEASVNDSRKSSIDLSGSQNSIPELVRLQQQQHPQMTSAATQSQQSGPTMVNNSHPIPHPTPFPHPTQQLPQSQMPSQHPINPTAFNSLFHGPFPFSPFGNFHAFPMSSNPNQQPSYPTNQFLPNSFSGFPPGNQPNQDSSRQQPVTVGLPAHHPTPLAFPASSHAGTHPAGMTVPSSVPPPNSSTMMNPAGAVVQSGTATSGQPAVAPPPVQSQGVVHQPGFSNSG